MQQYNDEIHLKDILKKYSEYKNYLLKKRFFIIGFAFLFLFIGFVISFASNTKYNAELTFVVESQSASSGVLGMSGIASQFGFDLGGSESTTFSQNNIIELLRSRGVIKGALMRSAKINNKQNLLIEHYLEVNQIEKDWSDKGISISFHDRSTYAHDSIIQIVLNDIRANLIVGLQSKDASIIALSYASLNEEFAKEFTEHLIYEMEKMYVSHETSQANHTIEFLQSRADSVFTELEIAEQQYAKVKDINQRIIKASGRLKELQLMREVEVLNTMYLEIIKNIELSKITLLQQTPMINIVDPPILPLNQKSIPFVLSGFLGCLFGIFISSGYLVFRKTFKDTLAKEN